MIKTPVFRGFLYLRAEKLPKTGAAIMDEQCEITERLRKIRTARGIGKKEQDEILAITQRKAKEGIQFDVGHFAKRDA
ncbi:hypothetical protein RI570_20210 [Brucella pseudogrignonensis]|uniref:hypothetical protein n=1 Tax=Brucella pseudogrignonensis TaxID=419475 RepID=UPI0028B4E97A|nr:hypothetical protein [Brucella pseudogrignonensis]MDT6942389.1 hypothetical protein [Brucella pseudogrignonensis]